MIQYILLIAYIILNMYTVICNMYRSYYALLILLVVYYYKSAILVLVSYFVM